MQRNDYQLSRLLNNKRATPAVSYAYYDCYTTSRELELVGINSQEMGAPSILKPLSHVWNYIKVVPCGHFWQVTRINAQLDHNYATNSCLLLGYWPNKPYRLPKTHSHALRERAERVAQEKQHSATSVASM
ncbi:hypothetical protein CBL_07407 [Carabus blaptoides fortunei]